MVAVNSDRNRTLIDWLLSRQIWPHNINTWPVRSCNMSITTNLQQIWLQFNSLKLTTTLNLPLLWIFSFFRIVLKMSFVDSKQQIRLLHCLEEWSLLYERAVQYSKHRWEGEKQNVTGPNKPRSSVCSQGPLIKNVLWRTLEKMM